METKETKTNQSNNPMLLVSQASNPNFDIMVFKRYQALNKESGNAKLVYQPHLINYPDILDRLGTPADNGNYISSCASIICDELLD